MGKKPQSEAIVAKRAAKTQPEDSAEEAAEGWADGSAGRGRASSKKAKAAELVTLLVCLICNETPKAAKWGESKKGRPIGCFCFNCLSVIVSLFPNETPQAVAERYHADAKTKAEVDTGRRVLINLPAVPFAAPSQLESCQEQGHEISFNLAFVSEADIVKLTKVSPKALHLQQVQMDLEQYGCSLKGYLLQPRDLPDNIDWHHVKVYARTSIRLVEEIVPAGRQLSESQPLRLFEHLSQAQAERNPQAFKCSSKQIVPTLDSLLEKAAKVIENRQKNDAQKSNDQQQQEDEEESEDEEFEVVEDADEMPAPAAERPTFSLGAMLKAKESKEVAGSRRKTGKRRPDGPPEDDRPLASASGRLTTPNKPRNGAAALATPPSKPRARSRSRSPGMASSKKGKSDKDQLLRLSSADLGDEQLDEEMRRVEARCGGPPKPCLRALSVARHLAGEKLGVRLAAAKTLLLDGLNATTPKPKESVLLEARIKNCEFAAMLHNHARTLNGALLKQAVMAMKDCEVPLPTHVLCSLLERRAESFFGDAIAAAAKDDCQISTKQLDVNSFVALLVPSQRHIVEDGDPLKSTYATALELVKGDFQLQLKNTEGEGEDAVHAEVAESYKAIATSMKESFSTDSLIHILSSPSNRQFLTKLFGSLLRELNDYVVSEEFALLPDVIKEAVNAMKRTGHGCCALLSPMTSYEGSEISHASEIRSYKGKDPMEATYSKILQGEWFTKLHDECLKKAGSCKIFGPRAERVMQRLDMKADGFDAKIVLEFVVQELPGLRLNLRDGATNDMEASVRKITEMEIKKVLEVEDEADNKPLPRYVQTLLSAGTLVNLSELVKQLEAWRTKFSGTQAWAAVEEEATNIALIPNDAVQGLCLKKLEHAFTLVPSGEGYPDSVKQALSKAALKMMRSLKLKVQGEVNEAVSKNEFDTVHQAIHASELEHTFFYKAQLEVLKNGIQFRSHKVAFENLGKDFEARSAAEGSQKKLESLLKLRATLQTSMDVAADIICNQMQLVPDVADYDFCPSFRMDLDSSASLTKDVLMLQLTTKKVAMDKLITQLAEHTLDMDLPSDSWKKDLSTDAELKTVLHTASMSIGQLKGGLVTRCVTDLTKAISELEKLLEKFECALTTEEKQTMRLSVQAAQARVGQSKALVAEALLQHGLSHKVKTQGRDVIRSVLSQIAGGQVPEEMVFSTLVQAGREMIG